jgi:RimJ/RimL family protein N-acetyltransferase
LTVRTTPDGLVWSLESQNDLVAYAADAFETDRLFVRELAEDDLEAAFEIYASNPSYLELTSGAGGEPGLYDLEMLQRDFVVAQMTPGRRMAGIFLKESDEPVGVLDWMEENPSDGKPWIGLLIVHADRQRRGIAVEAFEGLAERLRQGGVDTVRAAVIARNPAGHALVRRLRFEPVATTTMRMTSEEEVLVFERAL